jgi:hypothetical protein
MHTTYGLSGSFRTTFLAEGTIHNFTVIQYTDEAEKEFEKSRGRGITNGRLK